MRVFKEMVSVRDPVIASSLIYSFLMLIILNQKPLLMFTEAGRVRPFGFKRGETIFPIHVVAILLGIFLYTLMAVYLVVD